MQRHPRAQSWPLLALCALSLALPAAGAAGGQAAAGAGPAAATPAGLREAASAAVGESDASFHVRRTGGALVSHAAGLSATFGRAGVVIGAAGERISLTPVGLGSAVTPVASGNRVSYRRGGVTEWYLNGPAGLEQGFTVDRRPAAGQLTIAQRLGGLRPRQDGQAIVFGSTLRYDGLRAVDAAGRVLPAKLALAGTLLRLVVDDSGARYPVTIDPMIQQGPALVPSDGAGFGDFGWSVALASSDGNTALVGAPNENSNVGAAWVFTRSGGTWTQQATLKPDPQTLVGGSNGTGFGGSVALSGDGNTAMIGGYQENDLHGAVWVATRTSGSWSTPTKIAFPSDENGTARFGSAVALAPDGKSAVIGGNGDGGGSVAAPVPNAGAAWVYADPGTGWAELTKVTGSGIEVGSGGFGSSVAIATPSCPSPPCAAVIAIGAPADNQGASANAPGKVWIFADTDGWLLQGTLFPSDMTTPASFGTSVALSADGTIALVGGPTDDPADDGSQTGSAWVFNFTALAGWQQTAHLNPTDVAGSFPPFFGTAVALSADANTALVGGDQDGGFAGAAWVFKNAAGWTQTCKEQASESFSSAFGHAVALSGDAGTELIGGPFSATTNAEGAAWAFVSGPCVSDTRSTVIDDQSARIQGTVSPNGQDTSYRIDYGTTTAYGQSTAAAPLAPNAAPVAVDQTLSGLLPATLYHYRIAATSSSGTAGPDRTFVTGNQLTGPPGTTVSGTLVTSSGCPQSATIDWGDGTQPGPGTVQCFNPPNQDAIDFTVSGSHTYAAAGHYSIVVTTDTQQTFGAGAVITAPPAPPSAGTAPAPQAPPTIAGEAAPSVGADSANVAASVNPNGSPTSVFVRYGTTAAYGQQTGAVAIGAGSTLQVVTQALGGLTPSTSYHFQFVATNAGGQTAGPDATFTTAVPGGSSAQPPPGPVQGVSVDVFPLVGTVLVNGQPLQVGQQIPLGSIVDARKGTVVLQTIVNGVVQSMQFAGGIFQVLQLPDGTLQLVLQGGDFSICKSSKPKKNATVRHISAALNAKTVRGLWGNGKGSFQTKGRYAAATVRGTIYHVVDRCDGTFTHVVEGTVSVRDFVQNKTVSVPAGGSYLAKSKP